MNKLPETLIGPAASVLEAARELGRTHDRIALLLEGDPGVGKTRIGDLLAAELTGSPFAVECVNGQSLSVDLVRQWRSRSAYGNLFSPWTVKRVDEIDQTSSSGMAELLTYLDYLPAAAAVIATTNEFAKLRALCKGRLETRFIRFHVDSPTVAQTARLLTARFKVPATFAHKIAAGSVPEGCLPTAGCNVRAAIRDAQGFTAARAAATRRAA